MRVYKFLNAEFGRASIIDRRMKVTTIRELNDPFEFRNIAAGDHELRMYLEVVRKQLESWAAMICFSKSWSNPVLWSHYADGHKGLCLEFEIPSSRLERMVYSDQRVSAEDVYDEEQGQLVPNKQALLKAKTVKHLHWSYEDEVRMPCDVSTARADKNGLYFTPFTDLFKLTGVIVGPESTLSRDEVESDLQQGGHDLVPIKARLAFQTFSVVTQRNKNLW